MVHSTHLIRPILRELLIRLRSHHGHLPDKRDDVPYRSIIQALAPRGHCAHLDAMLDGPERLLRVVDVFLREIGRMMVKSSANVRLRHPRCQMAADAETSVALRTGRDVLGVIEIGYVNLMGAH